MKSKKQIVAAKCPDCEKRTRMLQFFQEWYGWYSTCLRCGRQWDDGQRIPLEFSRYARRNNIENAKRRWRSTAIDQTTSEDGEI